MTIGGGFRLVCTGVFGLLALSMTAAESLLIKNGRFLTLKAGEEQGFAGYMTVNAAGRITSVAKGAPPESLSADRVVDVAGAFVAPGFISAHSHVGNAPFRGLGHTETLYGWSQATSRLNRHSTAEDVYWFSLSGSYDFLRNGITTVFDFTRARPASAGDAPGEDAYDFNQLRAKIDGGIRFINAVPLAPTGTHEEILGRLDALIAQAKATYGGNPLFLKMALSGGGHRATSKETIALEVEVMKTRGLMNQSHYLESPEFVPEQQAKFAWYVETGALQPGFIFGHFIHTTPEMIKTAAAAGAAMSWQPLSNGRLASGIADIVSYRAAGLKVGLGLDSNACTDTCDPFENMRVGMSLIRAKYQDAKAMPVYDLLRMHTLGSAEILQIADQVGSLEPGKFADFLVVDPRSPNTGPVHDAVGHYVLACGLRNVKQIYVGGRLMVVGTTLVTQDEAKTMAQVDARLTRIEALADAADKRMPSATPSR